MSETNSKKEKKDIGHLKSIYTSCEKDNTLGCLCHEIVLRFSEDVYYTLKLATGMSSESVEINLIKLRHKIREDAGNF